MSTIVDTGTPTLLNITRRKAPNGSVEMMMANTLTKELPLLEDIPWVEGNTESGLQITSVTALPSPTWRRVNQGVAPTKGETVQYTEGVGLLEQKSVIDVEAAKASGDIAAYREGEDALRLEGMSEELERAIFYEQTTVNPERIHGLSPRYGASTGYTASSYVQLVGTPGGSACHSIWIITWDVQRIFGIYPKGSVAGLFYEDLGQRPARDANGNEFESYQSRYVWKPGIAVKDYRFAVRIQWDTADATNGVDSSKALFLALENGLSTIRKVNGSTRIYWNRTSRKKVAAQLASNNTNYLQWTQQSNEPLMQKFLGVPCRLTDTLIAETALS